MPGALLKLLVKDQLPNSREVPVNAKEWQLKPLRRENEAYSRKVPVNVKEWQLKPLKREKDYSHFRSV